MADKKGVILIRFPEDLATRLRRISFEIDEPIKDIVSDIIVENIEVWFANKILDKFGENHDSLRKIKGILEQVPVAASSNRPDEPVGVIQDTKEYLTRTVNLIRDGYVPLDLLCAAPSLQDSSQEGPVK